MLELGTISFKHGDVNLQGRSMTVFLECQCGKLIIPPETDLELHLRALGRKYGTPFKAYTCEYGKVHSTKANFNRGVDLVKRRANQKIARINATTRGKTKRFRKGN